MIRLRRCTDREISIASWKGLTQILRVGGVDLEKPPVDQETMAPSDVSLFLHGTVVTQSSTPNLFSASSVRESDVQTGGSSLTPDSIQISPRELTRSQGELVRISLKNVDPAIVSRRIVGKRTAISLALWFCLVIRKNVGRHLLVNRWIGGRKCKDTS